MCGGRPPPPYLRVVAARRVQVLILSPTRELAQQTEKVILAIGEYLNVQAHACIGGKSLGACASAREGGGKGAGVLKQEPGCALLDALRREQHLWAHRLLLACAGEDIRKLENGVHAVSGTPGRVFDMIKRKALRTR